MLVIKVYVNTDVIDEVWIHNITEKEQKINLYRIERPKGFENIIIKHDRRKPWYFLVSKVLKVLKEKPCLTRKQSTN